MKIAITLAGMTVVVGALLNGCAPVSRVQSNRAYDYRDEPRRLFVIANMGIGAPAGVYLGFERGMREFAARCVKDIDFSRVDALELDSAVHDRRLREFDPDTHLILRFIGGAKYHSQIVELRYDAQLVDMSSKKRVWRAAMSIRSGLNSNEVVGEQMANDLVERMRADSIVKQCG